MVDVSVSASASLKIETKEEQYYIYGQDYAGDGIQEGSSQTNLVSRKRIKRIHAPSTRIHKFPVSKPILHMNRQRLSNIVRQLARAHNWKEASRVLSVLLKGSPNGLSLEEDQRNFQVAMEIYKRFRRESNYQMRIKQIYEVWMSKLVWRMKFPMKKHSIQLELALFHISQGNVQEAHNATKFLVQDRDSASDPKVNLLHGMILYQLWYSGLPEEMQIKGSYIHTTFDTLEMASNDACQETEMVESSNDHHAVDMENAKFASQIASESSVGNQKIFTVCKTDLPRKPSRDFSHAHRFYMSGSADTNEQIAAASNHDSSWMDSSIFFAQGLDTSLLPIRLKHSAGDLEQSIYSHRKLANEQYTNAVKHLQRALHSTPPLSAALQPLIQLLLLGDRVEEAFKELEKSCNKLDMALPFRLRARLLECFGRNRTTLISSCYENVLTRDPTCNYSLNGLIKMNKTGDYNTMQLLKMIALHLDAVDGKSSTWEEFASCFLKVLNAVQSDYEDRISINEKRSVTGILPPANKIPKAFIEGQVRDSWRLRCRWWRRRHFNESSNLSDMQTGDWKLLASKAASASHLYGPRFAYVVTTLGKLTNEGQTELVSFLGSHMQHSMKLYENLDATY